MNILSIPFHEFIAIKRSNKKGYLFMLEERPELNNHLNTVHASAQLALAEASSGEFLLEQFNDIKNQVIPVIRRTEIKYRQPGKGTLYTKCEFVEGDSQEFLKQFKEKKRIILKVKVHVFNEFEKRTSTAIFEWLIAKKVK